MRSLLMLLTATLSAQGYASLELEKKVGMELVTTVGRLNGQTQVESFLRNDGPEPVTVLLEEQLSFVTAELRDDQGNLLPMRDGRAAIGARAFDLPLHTVVLQPGQDVSVDVFSLIASSSTAIAGSLTWDLRDVRSRTLTLVMVYEMTEEALERAKHLKAPDVVIGAWRSAPVTMPFRNP
jgi:hypothetical protein